MYCQNKITYRIQEGDSLYKLAKQYKTTVTELILLNSGVNPYNLQVGMKITICPGEGYEMPQNMMPDMNGTTPSMPTMPSMNNTPQTIPITPGMNGTTPSMPMMPGMSNTPQTIPITPGMNGTTPSMPMMPGMNNTSQNMASNLTKQMHMAWMNHLILGKLFIMSILENLPNQEELKDALDRNAEEILSIFATYYPENVIQSLRNLLMEHLELTAEVADTLKKGDMAAYDRAVRDWYQNAVQIAGTLSRQTPAYNESELRNMFYEHLDLMRQQMEHYLNGEYKEDIDTFLEAETAMEKMAAMLAKGLMAR